MYFSKMGKEYTSQRQRHRTRTQLKFWGDENDNSDLTNEQEIMEATRIDEVH